jgi:hypothetical protein
MIMSCSMGSGSVLPSSGDAQVVIMLREGARREGVLDVVIVTMVARQHTPQS